MTTQIISEVPPLSIIHVMGWHLNKRSEPGWPNLGFTSFDISTNPSISPKQVLQELEGDINELVTEGHNVALVGDCIGGYYASHMASKYRLPAILINPLVKPYESLLLASLLEDKERELNLVQGELQELETPLKEHDSIMVMLQKGDKLQDYQQASDYYIECNQIVLNGGSHSFDGLANWVTVIKNFFVKHYE